MTAVAAARQVGARIELIDRPVSTTLSRLWSLLTSLQVLFCVWELLKSLVVPVSEDDLASLMSGNLDELVEQLGHRLPVVRQVLIEERDCYMAHKIQGLMQEALRSATSNEIVVGATSPASQVHRVVAVMGMGHMAGVREWILGTRSTVAPVSLKTHIKEISGPVTRPAYPYIRAGFRWALLSGGLFALYKIATNPLIL